MLGLVDLVAQGMLDGLPSWRLYTSTNRAESLLLQATAERADFLFHERLRALAVTVVNTLAESTGD